MNSLFSNQLHSSSTRLAGEDVERFERDGWVGKYPLLTSAGVAAVCQAHDQASSNFIWESLPSNAHEPDAFQRRPWFKSMHVLFPRFAEVAGHPAIVNRVASLLGPDILAWGVTTTMRRPGQRHPWHVDVEHQRWPGVTVFIGLSNISKDSTLKVISRSHKIDVPPDGLRTLNDEDALAESKRFQPLASLDRVELNEGEFFIFDGRSWHGSHNTGNETRMALIAQYCRPDAEVMIPLTWNQPVQWHSSRPPCILVRGSDRFGVNRVVPAPGFRIAG
jgi:Phytanoyl-CoA dioxygenase (PhyH)